MGRDPTQRDHNRAKEPGVKSLKTDLREELSQRVTITENGKTVKVSKQRVILKALAAKFGGFPGPGHGRNRLTSSIMLLSSHQAAFAD
jgi:hypothetical protein